MKPRCPLCGAKSTWRYWKERPDLNQKIPMDCHACRKQRAVTWLNWEKGIDVVIYGGKPFDANVEVPIPKGMPHLSGRRLA